MAGRPRKQVGVQKQSSRRSDENERRRLLIEWLQRRSQAPPDPEEVAAWDQIRIWLDEDRAGERRVFPPT